MSIQTNADDDEEKKYTSKNEDKNMKMKYESA